jgi:hypothetical protein
MRITVTNRERDALCAGWLDRVAGSYPEDTTRFLLGTGDPFANPVGAELRHTLAAITDALLEDRPTEDLDGVIDRFIRIRAVQEFPPGEAVAFILDLKKLVREQLGARVSQQELAAVDDWVDRLLLKVFTVYVQCRDEMHDIRVKAIRSQSLTVIERLNAWRTRRYGEELPDGVEPEEEP